MASIQKASDLLHKSRTAYSGRDRAMKATRGFALALVLCAVAALLLSTVENTILSSLALTGCGACMAGAVVSAVLVHVLKWSGDDAYDDALIEAKSAISAEVEPGTSSVRAAR